MSLIHELKKSDVFRQLSDEQLQNYASIMTTITLAKGEILFKHGTEPDALYVLLSGHLVALLENTHGQLQPMGNIAPGEIVGEMGVMTNQPRTMTIMAQRQSTVAKLEKSEFMKLYESNPQVLLPITQLVIHRMQTTLASLRPKALCDTILVLETDLHLTDEFHKAFQSDLLAYPERILMITENDFNKIPENEFDYHIDKLEQRYEIIFLMVPMSASTALLNRLVSHVTRILVLTRGYAGTEIPERILNLLDTPNFANAVRKEIVFCHKSRPKMPTYEVPIEYEEYAFTRRHHVIYDELHSRKRFLRFIKGKALGLVIGGGGTRIWAAVGAVQYLLEQGVEFDAVGGTSSGSIVAACLAYHYSGQAFLPMVESILSIDPNPLSIWNFTYPILSLLNGTRGTQGLRRQFSHHKFEDLLIECFAISCSLTSAQEVKHHTGYIWEAIRASVALPGIYPPYNSAHEHHELLVDGGVINNLPTDRMRELMENRGKVIAIDLSNVQSVPMKAPNLPSTLSFFEAFKYMWQGRRQPGQPNIFDVLLNSLMIASEIKSKDHRRLANILISPELKTNNILSITNPKELLISGRVAAAVRMTEIRELLEQ